MTDVKQLLESKIRPYGVTLEVGGNDKKIVEILKEKAREYKSRVDIINTKIKETRFEKHKKHNVYEGPALYWSSSIPNLEYDVVYLESDAFAEGETFVQLLHEYWPVVHLNGIICGHYTKEVAEALQEAYKNATVDVIDEFWYRIK